MCSQLLTPDVFGRLFLFGSVISWQILTFVETLYSFLLFFLVSETLCRWMSFTDFINESPAPALRPLILEVKQRQS